MHVLYVHQNFPAQFGHIATRPVRRHGFRCTFATARVDSHTGPIQKVVYASRRGPTATTHFASRSFESFSRQSHAVFEALQKRPDIRPDLVVGHSGFGSTLFLRDLYLCPIINLCDVIVEHD